MLCMREAKVLERLCVCTGWSELLLIADAISTKIFVLAHVLSEIAKKTIRVSPVSKDTLVYTIE